MSAEAIGVVLAAVGTLAGSILGYYVRAKVKLKRTDAEIALANEAAKVERQVAEESRVVMELSRHIDRLTADGNFLRKQVDDLRRDCDSREEELRLRADALEREYGQMRGEFERLRVWVDYLQDILRGRRIAFREYRPGVSGGSDSHTPLPPDHKSPGG